MADPSVEDAEEERASQIPYADEYGTVLDITAAGADPTGGTNTVPVFERIAGDDTMLYFPPGRYRMDEPFHFESFEHFALYGERATVVPVDGYDSVLFDLGRPGRATDLLVENLLFDMRAPRTGGRALSVLADDDVTIRGLSVVGTIDTPSQGATRVDITDPGGEGLVDRLRLADGSAEQSGATGCYVGDEHVGTVHFLDCHIDGFADNGLYADPVRGAVRVTGGYFANCEVSCLRVGNNSHVQGAHVRCDRAPDGFRNMRGIRLRNGTNVLIEDCVVVMRKLTGSDGAIVASKWVEAATVRDTVVRIDTDGISAIRVRDPAEGIDPSGELRFEGITITGTASDGPTVSVDERHNTVFDSIELRQTGENRDGFLFDDTRGGIVRNSFVEVTGEPVVTHNSTLELIDIRTPLDERPTGTATVE